MVTFVTHRENKLYLTKQKRVGLEYILL